MKLVAVKDQEVGEDIQSSCLCYVMVVEYSSVFPLWKNHCSHQLWLLPYHSIAIAPSIAVVRAKSAPSPTGCLYQC